MNWSFGFALLVASISVAQTAALVPVEPTSAQTNSSPTTPPASGQAAPNNGQPVKDANGVYTIRRSSRLVVLDVVVTDAKGNLVTDLKKDDFSVTEAKEPQTILNFEEAGSHLLSPVLTINSTAELDQQAPRAPVNIILLDEFNTRFEDMAFARYSLKKFLEKQPEKLDTPTMLVAVNLQHFTVLRDYTQDKQGLIDALDHHFAAYPWQAQQGQWKAERFGTAFSALMQVAQATVGHQGHKNMIWIGRGFPAVNFANAVVDAESRVNSAVQECVNMLRDARVTLYSVDPAGVMVDPGVYGQAAAFNDPFGGNYTFSKLARATGGKALYGRNDVDAEIATGIRDGKSFYTLTYRPGNTSTDPRKFRKIAVTVDRPGLTATTREGYYLAYGPPRVDPSNPSRRLAFDLVTAENSSMVYDGVPFTLIPVAGDTYSYTAKVEARGLNWTYATDTEPRHAELILMVTTFDKKGKELNRSAKSIKISAPKTVAPTGRLEMGTELPVKIEHDAKAVKARIVVRVTSTGRIGTQDVSLVPGA